MGCEAGYDRLAKWYACIERLRFRGTLQRARLSLLDELPSVQRVLFLGEGDGRLLVPFARRQPQAEIVSLDISGAMIRRQYQRFTASGCSNRIRWVQANVSRCPPPATVGTVSSRTENLDDQHTDTPLGLRNGGSAQVAPERFASDMIDGIETLPSVLIATRFDLVVTPFFLDCFDAVDQPPVIASIAGQMPVPAWWYYVDFRVPAAGWPHWWARYWLWCMHAFFRVTTDLRSKDLADPTPSFSAHGFACQAERRFELGMITAQLWRRHHQ